MACAFKLLLTLLKADTVSLGMQPEPHTRRRQGPWLPLSFFLGRSRTPTAGVSSSSANHASSIKVLALHDGESSAAKG